ncbi:hypothetical protein KIL84_013783 [Mauremys mutica]|uniref:Uncharacterized protein n=1 Tax=Mauremys mutica TaxID=74926 RepID=A0A9D3WXJ5_9SAUR|nr:hypothetical protein KIL84_013783 [Mauremys mutica]
MMLWNSKNNGLRCSKQIRSDIFTVLCNISISCINCFLPSQIATMFFLLFYCQAADFSHHSPNTSINILLIETVVSEHSKHTIQSSSSSLISDYHCLMENGKVSQNNKKDFRGKLKHQSESRYVLTTKVISCKYASIKEQDRTNHNMHFNKNSALNCVYGTPNEVSSDTSYASECKTLFVMLIRCFIPL